MQATTKLLCVVLALTMLSAARADDDFKRERREGEEAEEKNKAKDVLEGKPPPALAVTDWQNTDGKELTLAGLKGKVVVLDFWGVWCGPCRSAMPHLKELYAKYKDDGLVVIGVHTKTKADEMPDYIIEAELPWAIAVDAEGETVKSFAVDSYPDYYVIDRQGNLRVADLVNSELDRVVEALLKE